MHMNGAEAFVATLAACGVDTCFANPGTSEMQLVAAIDREPAMRAVLCLFEGVVTGAADGYARMADKPAVTLLHLGPGLGNGLANLHNARRAGSPVINMVGDHATYHLHFNAPLTSDAAGVARPMSDWVRVAQSPRDLAHAGAEAFAVSTDWPGRVATVIVPADHAWGPDAAPVAARPAAPAPQVPPAVIAQAAAAIRAAPGEVVLLLGGRALRDRALHQAGRIAAATGARLVCETFAARLQRGAGRVALEKLPYFAEMACEFLEKCTLLVTCGTEPPVAFFAYPGKPSALTPPHAACVRLASLREDPLPALSALADALDAPADPVMLQPRHVPAADAKLTPAAIGAVLSELMPHDAIVADETISAGMVLFETTGGAARHDWLMVTGGAIGQGLPVAVGAAVACPDRRVIALQADGSAMYTVQALWSMAREALDCVVVILDNASYAILNIELARVGVANAGPKALSMLSLNSPRLDWCAIAQGMGVPAERANDTAAFRDALAAALARRGPSLIAAVLNP